MTRFSLRDVFWLTLVVGMGCAWWVRERRLEGDHREAIVRQATKHDAELNALNDQLVSMEGAWLTAAGKSQAFFSELAKRTGIKTWHTFPSPENPNLLIAEPAAE